MSKARELLRERRNTLERKCPTYQRIEFMVELDAFAAAVRWNESTKRHALGGCRCKWYSPDGKSRRMYVDVKCRRMRDEARRAAEEAQ